MSLLYSISIRIYYLLILVSSLFNKKARLWISGRKNLLNRMKEAINTGDKIVWFHSASLGEFEQGRPVLEAFKQQYPEYKILLTFYSPSGFEIQKNYQGADYIFYLPLDTPGNAKKFIQIVKPAMVFFIKYDFWYHFLTQLHSHKIPVFLISGIFRKEQLFFKKYGGWYRKFLQSFTCFFLQNQESKELLRSIGIVNCEVSGDTRFDRVSTIAGQQEKIQGIDAFAGGQKVIVAGSTWSQDEELLVSNINSGNFNCKWIIAPHEIDKYRIRQLQKNLKEASLLFSCIHDEDPASYNILIIDKIGILSKLYQYAYLAYIGGGFGKGIHNILEAAVFGIPVIFGPNYRKSKEATDLIKLQAAISISDAEKLSNGINRFLTDQNTQKKYGTIAGLYVSDHAGSTDIILQKIRSISGLRNS